MSINIYLHYKIVNYCGFLLQKETGRLLQIDRFLFRKKCQQRPHACTDDLSTCFYISQVAENTLPCIALYIDLFFNAKYFGTGIRQTLTVFFLT